MSDYRTWDTPRWRPPRSKLLIQRDLMSWRLLHKWYSYRRRMQYRTRRSMISFVRPCKFLSGHISLVTFLFLSAPFRKIKKEIIFLLMAWRNLWPFTYCDYVWYETWFVVCLKHEVILTSQLYLRQHKRRICALDELMIWYQTWGFCNTMILYVCSIIKPKFRIMFCAYDYT